MIDTKLGEILRWRRLELGLSEAKIAYQLRIKTRDIVAIEEENWQKFNKNLYLNNVVLSYCRLLRIDQKIIDEKIKNLPTSSNVKNVKHSLVNIGQHIELSPDDNIFSNFLTFSVILFFIFLIIYNFIENKKDPIAIGELLKKGSEITKNIDEI